MSICKIFLKQTFGTEFQESWMLELKFFQSTVSVHIHSGEFNSLNLLQIEIIINIIEFFTYENMFEHENMMSTWGSLRKSG